MKSIYSDIMANIGPDGELPRYYHLPSQDGSPELFADGAEDGIMMYHMGRIDPSKSDWKKCTDAIRFAAADNMEKADALLISFFKECPMLAVVDSFRIEIGSREEEWDVDRIYRYGIHLVLKSDNKECVKAGLTILSLFDLPEPLREVIRNIGLSDEFTLFSLMSMRNQEEIFEIAQKVHGWGRIHAVEDLEPETPRIRRWILYEGSENDVMPQYSALTCFHKADVPRLLERKHLSQKEIRAILRLIDYLLDEGPVPGVSALNDPVSVFTRAVERASELKELTKADRGFLTDILTWQRKHPAYPNAGELGARVQSVLKGVKNASSACTDADGK